MCAGAWGNSLVCGDELDGRDRLASCNDERPHDGEAGLAGARALRRAGRLDRVGCQLGCDQLGGVGQLGQVPFAQDKRGVQPNALLQ